jgi:hypothetical protein
MKLPHSVGQWGIRQGCCAGKNLECNKGGVVLHHARDKANRGWPGCVPRHDKLFFFLLSNRAQIITGWRPLTDF